MLLSKQIKNPIESKKTIQKIHEDVKKKELKKRKEKQASLGKSLKLELISQTHNLLNSIAKLNT